MVPVKGLVNILTVLGCKLIKSLPFVFNFLIYYYKEFSPSSNIQIHLVDYVHLI